MTETVKTGVINQIQPWQAIFGLFSYVIGTFAISDSNVLILCGMILATLGFVMKSTYKHKEAIKEVVAPWLVERILDILGEYTGPENDIEPSITTEERLKRIEAIATSNKEIIDRLSALIAVAEGGTNGTKSG